MISTTHKSIQLDFETLEKEWFSLSSIQEKKAFWDQMHALLANAEKSQIIRFFDQLNQSVSDVSDRLELAKKRAALVGFIPGQDSSQITRP